MLHDRAPERGIVEAVDSTFSGDEPCPMCQAVQEEKQQQREEAPIPETESSFKLIPVKSGEVVLLIPVSVFVKRVSVNKGLHVKLVVAPETPPPDRPLV